MALPLSLSGLTVTIGVCGPFKSSGGNYYIVGRSSAATTKLQAQKASDPTSSFSAVGTDPSPGASVTVFLGAIQSSDKILIVALSNNGGNSVYYEFDMSTDTWSSSSSIGTTLNRTQAKGALVERSNGDIVVAASGALENVMGTNYSRVVYSRRISGVWTTGVDVAGTGGAVHYNFLGASLGSSDSVHIGYLDFTNSLFIQRTLNSSNSLQTASTGVACTGSGTGGDDTGGQAVSDASGNVCFAVNDNGTIKSFYFASANTPTINSATIASSAHAAARAAISKDGTDFWAGYVLAADSDYYVRKSTDQGATWGSANNAATATIGNAVGNIGIQGPVYLRGSNYVYGFVYNDNGTLKYNEYNARAAANAYTIVAGAGSYALTGTAATLKHAWKLTADAGSYALTGTAATLRHNYPLIAGAGSYALTGTTAALKHGWAVAAAAGSYALTGTAATLRRNLPLVAGAGSYSLTGTAASTLHGWKVTAAAGSYALTGTAASLLHNWKVAAGAGAYSITGTAAAVLHAWKVGAGSGSYLITGTDADLNKQTPGAYNLIADAGSYSLTGTAASVLHTWKMAAGAGSYALTGTAASVLHGWKVAAGAGSYSLSGTAASIRHGWKVTAGAGSYALTGTAASVRRSYRVVAGGGSYQMVGASANLVLGGSSSIFLGSTPVQNIYIGSTPIVAVYRGTEQVF